MNRRFRSSVQINLLLGAVLLSGSCARAFPDANILNLLLLNDDSASASFSPPSVASVSPVDGTTQVSVLGTTFTITFSEAMDPSTVVAQTTNGACSGSVQISTDNFASCPAITLTTTDNISFSFTPTITSPTAGLNVRLLVTTAATSANNVAMESAFTSTSGITLFTPSDFAGLTLWLHADTFINSGLTDGVSTIASWTDSSGQGNNAFQVTPANRPLYRDTAGPNNMPWLEFQSVNSHHLDLPEFMAFTDPTVFIVGFQTTGADQFFLSDVGAALPSRFNIGVDTADQLNVIIAETVGAGSADIFGGTALAGTAVSNASNGMTIMTVRKNGVDADAYLDGTQINPPTTATDGGFDPTTQWDGTTGVDNPRIGKRSINALTDFLNGGIAEIIIYNNTLSDANRARVECYLSRKYSIAGPTC